MAKWLVQAFQWHEMYCHDLEVMSSNPSRVELRVHCTFVLSRTWIKKINNVRVYTLYVGVSSVDCTVKPLVLEHTLLQSHFLWGECSAFLQLEPIITIQPFICSTRHPPLLGEQRQHRVKSLSGTFTCMANGRNRTPDLLILNLMP